MRSFCALLVGLACVSAASASMSIKMGISPNKHPYLATVMTGPIKGHAVGTTFDTFCLEKQERFRAGNVYDVELSMMAKDGGGGPNPDPLDIRTAWVYSNWLDGNLSSYTGKQVQRVIWYLEQEIGNLKSSEQSLLALANAGGAAWGNDFHGVMVMNLSGPDFDPAQSQLVRSALPLTSLVPVPGAALLGLLGLSALARVRRS